MPSLILCIDDCPQVLKLRKVTLEGLGYAVEIAPDTSSGLKTLEQMRVDVVLLEYKLEGIDAEAVALHLKQRFPALPIILLSAYHEMPGRILWLVDEYLMKSEPVEALVETIERVTRPNLGERRAAA